MPRHHADHDLQSCEWSFECHKNIRLGWVDEIPANLVLGAVECRRSAPKELNPETFDSGVNESEWVPSLSLPGLDQAPALEP